MRQHRPIAEYKVVHGVPSTIERHVNHYLELDFELYGRPMVLATADKIDIMVQTMIRYKTPEEINDN